MRSVFNFKVLLILVLFGIVVIQQWKRYKYNPAVETITIKGKPYPVIERIIDTLEVEKTSTITIPGEDIYHDTTIYVEVYKPFPVDTVNVIRDYFSKRVYSDTLKIGEDLGFVYVRDTISENSIQSRTYTYNIKERVVSEKIIVKDPPKTQVYLGFNAGVNTKNLGGTISTGLLLKTKTDKIFHLTGGLNSGGGSFSPFIGAGAYFKLSLKN
jgi:hypothetical protein